MTHSSYVPFSRPFLRSAHLSLWSTHYRRGACFGHIHFVDGARHCRDSRGGVELDSFTHSVLGD